jgi:hypothetical protein
LQVGQCVLMKAADAKTELAGLATLVPNLVLVFGAVARFTDPDCLQALRAAFPSAHLIGCSTAGEIGTTRVNDDTLVVTAVRMERTPLRTASTRITGMDDSYAAGERMGSALQSADLKAVLVFGPGVNINGSALVAGIASKVGDVPITGGLAGDGGAFRQTFTLGDEGIRDDAVVAVGFHGDALLHSHGSFGGWEPFGPARKVTRCAGNVLYELDGKPALEIYTRYLGDHAANLPASGLLFPFAMLGDDHRALGLIRTILGVDTATGSLTLAGDIHPDGYLKLMHAGTDGLVEGAATAAETAAALRRIDGASLAVLVSCVGRKLVMGDRVDEEIEAVSSVLGPGVTLAGFYSYGEISPFKPDNACRLHNQTMTLTWIGER